MSSLGGSFQDTNIWDSNSVLFISFSTKKASTIHVVTHYSHLGEQERSTSVAAGIAMETV